MLIYYDIDNTVQIFREIPFLATKRRLNNSEMAGGKNNEKWYERWSNLSFVVVVFSACQKNVIITNSQKYFK